MFEKYKKYLKDNPQGYWFKRKLYGWGEKRILGASQDSLRIFMSIVK